MNSNGYGNALMKEGAAYLTKSTLNGGIKTTILITSKALKYTFKCNNSNGIYQITIKIIIKYERLQK